MALKRFTFLAFFFFFILILIKFSFSKNFILILHPNTVLPNKINTSFEENVSFNFLKFVFVNSTIENISEILENFKNISLINNYQINFSEIEYNLTINLSKSFKLCLVGSDLKSKVNVVENSSVIYVYNISNLWDFLKGLKSCIDNGSDLILLSKPYVFQEYFQIFPLIFDELIQEKISFVIFLNNTDYCYDRNVICLKRSNETYVKNNTLYFNSSLILNKFLQDLVTLKNLTKNYIISKELLFKTFNLSLINFSYEIGNTLTENKCSNSSLGFVIFKNGTSVNSSEINQNMSEIYSLVCFQYNGSSRKIIFNFTKPILTNFSIISLNTSTESVYFNVLENLSTIVINSTNHFYLLYFQLFKKVDSNYFLENKAINFFITEKSFKIFSKAPLNYKYLMISLYFRDKLSIVSFLLEISNYSYFFYLPKQEWISLGSSCHVGRYKLVGCKENDVVFVYWDPISRIWRTFDLKSFIDKPYGFFGKNFKDNDCFVLLKCDRNYRDSLNVIGGWNLISPLSKDYFLSLSTLLLSNKSPIFNIIAVNNLYCFNINGNNYYSRKFGYYYKDKVTVTVENVTEFFNYFKECKPFSFWIYVAQDIRGWEYYYPYSPNLPEK